MPIALGLLKYQKVYVYEKTVNRKQICDTVTAEGKLNVVCEQAIYRPKESLAVLTYEINVIGTGGFGNVVHIN